MVFLRRSFLLTAEKIIPSPLFLRKKEIWCFIKIGKHKVYFPCLFDPSFLDGVYEEIFVHRVYEHGRCQVRPGTWVIDAGACEGFFSLYALEKGANVLAFEPVPELVQALERTLSEFIKSGRARIFPIGLGRGKEERVIRVYRDNVGASTLRGRSR